MFISSSNYLTQIEKLLESSNELSIAVAFWGSGSEKLFQNLKNKPIRIICNLSKGGTNPTPINILRQQSNIEIRQLDNIHAKVVLGDSNAIIGSANFSTNGLNEESSKVVGWEEAGFLLDTPEFIVSAKHWFEIQWKKSSEISDEDISRAQEKWLARRFDRADEFQNTPLIDKQPEFFKDRQVYLFLHRGKASEKAVQIGEAVKEETLSIPGLEVPPNAELDYFEQSEDLPEGSLISVYFGKRGAIKVYDAYNKIPVLDRRILNDEDGVNWVRFVYKNNSILNHSFDLECQKKLQELIESKRDVLRHLIEQQGWIVPLYDLLSSE